MFHQAYVLSKKADLEVQQRHYDKAASYFSQASEKYSEAIELTNSPDVSRSQIWFIRWILCINGWPSQAKRTLGVLKSQSAAHSTFLSDPRNVAILPQQPKPLSQSTSKNSTSPNSSYAQPPISSGNLTNSLASARGKPVNSVFPSQTSPHASLAATFQNNQRYKVSSASSSPSNDPTKRGQTSSPRLGNPDEEPYYKFYSNMTTIVTKTYTQTRDRTRFTNKYHQMKKSSSNTSPTESYYVVPVGADLTAENASLKESLKQTTQALEAYSGTFERQKDAIKSSLAQLRSELQAIEHAKVQELNATIEELQTENDRLKIQMGRMKSRWEGLKESARKRRWGALWPGCQFSSLALLWGAANLQDFCISSLLAALLITFLLFNCILFVHGLLAGPTRRTIWITSRLKEYSAQPFSQPLP